MIYKIIEPVDKEQASVGSPADNRALLGIIVAVIVYGRLDGEQQQESEKRDGYLPCARIEQVNAGTDEAKQ